MILPPIPENEPQRQAALDALRVVDTPLEERFERITRLAARLMHTPMAAITLIDGERQWLKSAQGLAAGETHRNVSFCAHTILAEGTMVVEDATRDERFHDNPYVTGEPCIRFYAGHVIRSPEGCALGSLCVIDSLPRKVSAQELDDLRDLAAMVETELRAKALLEAQAQMILELEKARRSALLDPLTRLWNRAGAQELLARHWQLATARGEAFHLGLADLDFFKSINDTHGHEAGDAVLRAAAKCLVRALEGVGVACRYGGEEFLLLIQAGTAGEALRGAEEICTAMRRAPVQVGGKTISFTTSIGLSACNPKEEADWQAALERADAALYAAKRAGRNRVAHFADLGAKL